MALQIAGTQPVWNFEQEPYPPGADETDINLRAYFDRMPDDQLLAFNPAWTDEQVMAWDGNFKDDGTLMLICSERDVDVTEYRQVISDCLAYRARTRLAAS
ncbi:MAG: hypothetical protein KBF25_05435 [Chitinophagaceae bacterium]|nr:hypothetical protein [Chitinophagaceae bacterium]